MLLPSTFFISLGHTTSQKPANLPVMNSSPHMHPFADYDNIKDCYYGNLVNTEEYM